MCEIGEPWSRCSLSLTKILNVDIASIPIQTICNMHNKSKSNGPWVQFLTSHICFVFVRRIVTGGR